MDIKIDNIAQDVVWPSTNILTEMQQIFLSRNAQVASSRAKHGVFNCIIKLLEVRATSCTARKAISPSFLSKCDFGRQELTKNKLNAR